MSDGNVFVAEMQRDAEPPERLKVSREEHLAKRIHQVVWALARMNFTNFDLEQIAKRAGELEKIVERRKNQLQTP